MECHLLLLVRCINMKKGVQTEMLLDDISEIMDILNEVAKISDGIKPYFFVMKAYFAVLHARYDEANSYLQRAQKYAIESSNLMALAWILCNKRVKIIFIIYIFCLYIKSKQNPLRNIRYLYLI